MSRYRVALVPLALALAECGGARSDGPGDGDSDIDADIDADSDTDSGSDTEPILDCPGGNVGRIESHEIAGMDGECGPEYGVRFEPPYEFGAEDRLALDLVIAPHPDTGARIGMEDGSEYFAVTFWGPEIYVVGDDGGGVIPYEPYAWNITHAEFRFATQDWALTVNGVDADPLRSPWPVAPALRYIDINVGGPCEEAGYLDSLTVYWISGESENVILDDDFDGPIDDDDIPAHWNVESVPPPAWLGCPPAD